MSNLFSGILAVIIALVSMCGGLTNAQVDKPVSIEISANLDGDFSSLGDTAAMVQPLLGLVGELTIGFAADPAGVGELKVLRSGEKLASFAVQKQEDGSWVAVSNLFPNYAITVKDETVQAMTSQMMGASNPLSSIDAETLTAIMTPVTELFAAFAEKAGEPETGSWEFNGTTFTTKIPYNVTTKEAITMVLETLKKIVSDEKVAGVLSQIGAKFGPEQIDSALENIANADESEQPVLTLNAYSNEEGNACVELLLAKEDQSMSLLFTRTNTVMQLDFDILGQAKGSLKVDAEAKTLDANISFASGTTAVDLALNAVVTDEGGNLAISANVASGENAISAKLNIKLAYEAPEFAGVADQKVLAMEELMTGAVSEEELTAFQTDMMTGFSTILQAVPEIMQLMTPTQNTTPAE